MGVNLNFQLSSVVMSVVISFTNFIFFTQNITSHLFKYDLHSMIIMSDKIM